jgi:alpha-1,6-mannosyltransferase
MMLASCDAYVHAGDQETFGLGVLEAMACGTPVVTTTAGGLGELAEGVATRVDGQSSCDWAEAMYAALRDEDRDAYRLAERALDKARQHDWSVILKQLSARYSRLVARHVPAAAIAPVPAMRMPPRLGTAVQRT